MLKTTHTQVKGALSCHLFFKVKCFKRLTGTKVLVEQETCLIAVHPKVATNIRYLSLLIFNQDFPYNWPVLLKIRNRRDLYS